LRRGAGCGGWRGLDAGGAEEGCRVRRRQAGRLRRCARPLWELLEHQEPRAQGGSAASRQEEMPRARPLLNPHVNHPTTRSCRERSHQLWPGQYGLRQPCHPARPGADHPSAASPQQAPGGTNRCGDAQGGEGWGADPPASPCQTGWELLGRLSCCSGSVGGLGALARPGRRFAHRLTLASLSPGDRDDAAQKGSSALPERIEITEFIKDLYKRDQFVPVTLWFGPVSVPVTLQPRLTEGQKPTD